MELLSWNIHVHDVENSASINHQSFNPELNQMGKGLIQMWRLPSLLKVIKLIAILSFKACLLLQFQSFCAVNWSQTIWIWLDHFSEAFGPVAFFEMCAAQSCGQVGENRKPQEHSHPVWPGGHRNGPVQALVFTLFLLCSFTWNPHQTPFSCYLKISDQRVKLPYSEK